MLFLLVVAILFTLLGVVLTLVIEWHYLHSWLEKQPQELSSFQYEAGLPRYQLPKELKDLVDKNDASDPNQQQACLALNLFFQFLFKELKDTKRVRRWFMKKLTMEFEELLQKTTTGKLIDQITLRDLSLGTQFPIIKEISVGKVSLHETQDYIDELDIVMNIEYLGDFQLSVDADLVLGRSAYLSVKIMRLTGKIRLQLTRTPFTHWSIVFCQEPQMELKIESQFQGRPVPQVTSLIMGQIRRAIKKKHTLPNYKVRFKPFFEKQEAPCGIDEIRNSTFADGELHVTIIACSRLIKNNACARFYCTLAIDSVSWVDLFLQRLAAWTIRDVEVNKLASQAIGIIFTQEYIPDKGKQCVIIENVIPESPASLVDLHKKDVLISINGVKINSFNQTAKLLRQQNNKFLIRIERANNLRPSHSHDALSKLDEQIVNLKDVDANLTGEEEDDFINIKIKSEDSDGSPNSRTPTHGSPVKKIFLSAQSGLFMTLDRRRKSDSFETLKVAQDKLGSTSDTIITDEPFRKNADVRKTSLVSGTPIDPVWEEKFNFDVDTVHKFLNVVVWYKSSEQAEKNQKNDKEKSLKVDSDVQLGQVSIPLLDIALECATNSHGFHQQTFQLKPPDLKPTASRLHKLSSHPGFDESLCYGDITISFVHKPESLSKATEPKNGETASPSAESDDENDSVVGETVKEKECPDMMDVKTHDFIGTQFKAATLCHFCGKKIWLKVAFQCTTCKMISHKKCVSKCHSLTICTMGGAKLIPQMASQIKKKPEIVTTDMSNENSTETAELGVAATESAGNGVGVSPPGSPKIQRRSIPSLLINLANTAAHAKSGLTRAGSAHNLLSPSQQSLTQSKSLPPSPQHSPLGSRKASIQENPFVMNNDSDLDDVKLTVQRLLQHPNDEMLVSEAKKMGKELFAGLDHGERKTKLNEMVKKVQLEIDAEANNRATLSRMEKEAPEPTQKMRLALQIGKSDERSRALAVLLLHYYAGIQHCQETEVKPQSDTVNALQTEVEETGTAESKTESCDDVGKLNGKNNCL